MPSSAGTVNIHRQKLERLWSMDVDMKLYLYVSWYALLVRPY